MKHQILLALAVFAFLYMSAIMFFNMALSLVFDKVKVSTHTILWWAFSGATLVLEITFWL